MKIGTIGTNFITDYILENIEKTEGLSCGAVYSRKEETGRKLADKYRISKVYTDLDQMLQDDSIDCIYIASPNSLHFEQAKKQETAVPAAFGQFVFLFDATTVDHHRWHRCGASVTPQMVKACAAS